MARKRIVIDWNRVNELLKMQCSGVEVAAMLGICEDTLYQHCKTEINQDFQEYSRIKKAEGKSLLKIKQWEVAMQGDKTLLIFLGKNYLGQTDKQRIDYDSMPPVEMPTINIQFRPPGDE